MSQVKPTNQSDLFDTQIIPSNLAITAMRDSGYKNTAYALAELIDNAQQAKASSIEVLCFEKNVQLQARSRSRLFQIGVLDNGEGMNAITLRRALQFGNGGYLQDRSGIGRFGMGLPNASISQARRVDVWTWQNGSDNALKSYLDIDKIEARELTDVPKPIHDPVPDIWREVSKSIGSSGTLVVWSKLDTHRLTWRTARTTLNNTERLVGRIYRRFLLSGALSIRLFACDEQGNSKFDQETEINDPIYLTPTPRLPTPFNQTPMFDHIYDVPTEIEFEGKTHTVQVKYSVAKSETVELAGTKNRGDMPYGKDAGRNIGVSVIRADRELMMDHGWCIGYDPRERWWGAEVDFPPELDEIFGVTNNKQSATHFSELALTQWEELAEDGEHFIDVVKRLKEEGDPRGWLLELSDSIKKNLSSLREIIKGQASGSRSSRPTRHNDPDDVTATTNERWNRRSEERPIEGENIPLTPEQLEQIEQDLTDNKNYSKQDAKALVDLIQEADLRVVFLEAEFPDYYQLFNVEVKGPVTEVTFNRRHPAFDDIFGTINTVDEDINDLTQEEVLDRLTRAVNASKIIFAGWARYEREAGMDRARALGRVRLEWGQISAKFLEPEDEL